MSQFSHRICFAGLLRLVVAFPHLHAAPKLHVAPGGNDAWSGMLAKPKIERSDGPLASLEGARLKVRDDLVPAEMRGGAKVGILYADPMFDEEAMQQRIFRFKPSSPAIELGVQPIDLSNVGSTLARQ